MASEPAKFSLPRLSETSGSTGCTPSWPGWSVAEMRGLVTDAWRMCVPKFLHDRSVS